MTVAFQFRPRRYGSTRRPAIGGSSGGGYTQFTPLGGISSNILPLPVSGAPTTGGPVEGFPGPVPGYPGGGNAGDNEAGDAPPFQQPGRNAAPGPALSVPFPGAAYAGAVPDKGIVIWHDPALGRDRYFQGSLELSPSAAVNAVAQGSARAGGMLGARDTSGKITGPLYSTPANPNPSPTPVYAGPVITSRDSSGKVAPPSTYIQADARAPYGKGGQGAPGQQFRNVNGTAIAFNNDADKPIYGAPGGSDQPISIFDPRYPQGFSASADDISKYLKGLGSAPAPAIYDHGGMLEEPMVGHGMRSGRVYIVPRGSKVTANKNTPEEKGEREDRGESAAQERREEKDELPQAPVAHHAGAHKVDVHVSMSDGDERAEPRGSGKETEPEPGELPDAPVARPAARRPRRTKAA